MEKTKLVLLCGGSGSRLWPLSRSNHPKPFINFFGDLSLFQDAVKRATSFCLAPLVVCGESHQFLAKDQLEAMGITNYELILEPEGKNTAPAAALAALYLNCNGEDPLMVISPADQTIRDVKNYQAAINLGLNNADEFTIFGCKPDSPHTGYGYIQAGNEIKPGIFKVERFIEKPILADAQRFIENKNFYWNSGIFICRASQYCELLKKFAPAIYNSCQASIINRRTDKQFIFPEKEAFSQCRSDSIDYAIAEKIQNLNMIALDATWGDAGSWRAIHEAQNKDSKGNTLQGNVVVDAVKNSYINAQSKLVVAIGVENLAIIETRDAVLILNKNEDQNLKNAVKKLEDANHGETQLPSCVHRPWGTYECLERAANFLVKRIKVKPQEKLSLQLHHHRSEHWIVVKGSATVTCGENNFVLHQNQSTFIPVKTQHRLWNNSAETLELIEVQCGEILNEDDIVRFDDVYGRETSIKTESIT